MKDEGKRKVQSKGEITLPKKFRDQNNIEPGDYIHWNIHSKNKSKIIIEVEKES